MNYVRDAQILYFSLENMYEILVLKKDQITLFVESCFIMQWKIAQWNLTMNMIGFWRKPLKKIKKIKNQNPD